METQPQTQPPSQVQPQSQPQSQSQSLPWTEKYRPSHFDKIVLSPANRALFANIVDTNFFPNLLVCGPGGNGKTTTILALVREHQRRYMAPDITRKGSEHSILFDPSTVLIMNASDDRGIDVVRSQIRQFTQAGNMFSQSKEQVYNSGNHNHNQDTSPSDHRTHKFVILDEADAMTRTAQLALKIIIQNCSNTNVRFCLICNYISKLDISLRREFMCVRFDQLPKSDICAFIRRIADAEKVDISDAEIDAVRQMHRSDLRSMVNHLQTFQTSSSHALTDDTWVELRRIFVAGSTSTPATTTNAKKAVRTILERHEITIRTLCAQYYSYWVQFPEVCTPEQLAAVERLMRVPEDAKVDIVADFFVQVEIARQ